MDNSTVYYVNPNTLVEIDIDAIDKNLVSSYSIDGQFTPNIDTVEIYYYDEGKRLSRYNYNYTAWTSHIDPTLVDTGKLKDLYIDPVEDGKVLGVVNGSVYIQYEFVTNKIGSNSNRLFYINSISTDRTEITLKSNDINNVELSGSTAAFIQELNSDTGYFQEFYLNFGENRKEIGVNLQLNNTNPNSPELIVKLYKALPVEFDTKVTLWIQTLLADPVAYRVEYDEIIELPEIVRNLRGPNTNLKAASQSSKSSNYQTYTSLKTTASSSLSNQVDNILAEKGVDLNIDYTDFTNFVHFSNAKKRLENFYYKVTLLEKYQAGINLVKTTYSSSYRASSLAISESVITDIITNFDGYEYFLYYSSESKAWPKTNSTQPYTLASTGSIQTLQWYGSNDLSNPYYGGQIYTASFYDNENQDNLLYSIPEFLREDPNNQPYEIFIEMIGQYFDNLFLYTDQITSKYNADNRLDFGISKDLVADTLRSFGMNIYENNFTTDDLYTALTGLTPSGSLIPLPFITTNYPVTGSGLEYIQTVISASNEIITLDDLNKAVYKRLYHNLPLLVKKKGTLAGLQLLVNSFGIPDTILRINEFGGKDKSSNTWDQWQEEYSYKYNTNTIGYITSSFELNSTWAATSNRPSAVEFRFQTPGIPSTNYYSQSLWSTDVGNSLVLKYNGSGSVSGSYSGSIVDPYYQYGVLEFYPSSSNTATTASIYLPFFDGGWWSVLINKTSATEFTVFAKNKIYNGDTGNILGYEASSSVTLTNPWATATKSYFASSSLNLKVFSGSLQELRYYTQPVSKDAFDAYVMNPNSIEQSDYLAFRGSLGGELYTGSVSIHPKVSGEQVTTSSFGSNSSYFITSSGYFNSNTETIFYDQVLSGVKNIISNRIRTGDSNGYGVVLSNQISTNQSAPTPTYTPNINYLEVGFSPQNEINEDINSQLGYFNIGEYIGDPRDISNDTAKYPALDKLSLDYFKKYSSSYNFTDYFRLIKFFDNSLFKLIKDFVPARTAAATGAIVKQHLLERNRQRPAQVSYSQPEYTGSVTSVARDYQTGSIGVFTGGAGGSVPPIPTGGIQTSFFSGSLFFASGGPNTYFYNLITNPTNEYYTYNISFDVPNGYTDGGLEIYDSNTIANAVVSESMANISGTTQNYTLVMREGISIYYYFNSINFLTLTNILVTHNLYDPSQGYPTESINGLAGIVNLPFNTAPYYTGDFVGSKIDVVNKKLQDNPLLGEAYRVSIPDLQDINVQVSGTLLIDDFVFNTTASIPFNIDTLTSPKFNTTTYQYTPQFGNVVDFEIVLQGTYSASQAGTPGTSSLIADIAIGSITGSAPRTLFTVIGGATSNFSGSFTQSIILPGDSYLLPNTYKVVLYESSSNGSAALVDVTASFDTNTKWSVTTENLAAQSTYYLDPTVYTQQNFPGDITDFSDYNTLLNNVYSNRVSNQYYDVDYSTNLLNPVNFPSIISQSALYAQVQDSNYTSGSAWSKARYSGTKLTSATYNIFTSGDISYGETAVIDSYSDYIGYFDTIESSDPEYPGGGIVNLQYLIHTDGTIIGLTAANENLFLVENTFKAGSPATFLGQSYSSTNSTTAVPIIEGGASYRTILVKSGSQSNLSSADLAIAFENYPNGYSSGGQDTIYDAIYFATSSINTRILQDSGSAPAYTTGWLSMMLRPSSSVAGICTGFSPQDNQISIWNKYQSKYYNTFIRYEETLFPLRTYDYIRFGLTNPPNITASVDYSFSSYALYRIVSSSIGDVNDIASNLTLEQTITGSFSANLTGSISQGFRIFRRVPDETKVTVSPLPAYLQNGILVPNNFNPNVDPLALARKVGLIT